MSKIIAAAAIRGSHKILERAEKKYQEALEKWGPNQEVGFPNTGYYLSDHLRNPRDPGKNAGRHEARPGALPGSHPPAGQGEDLAPLPGPGPGRGHGHLLCRGDHRGHPLPGGPEFLREGGRPHDGQPLARRGRRRHPPETRHRVRGRHRPGFCRHPGGGADQGDRREDRPGAPGEEPLRLHGRGAQRETLFRTAGGGRRPDRLADPAGLLRPGLHGHRLRHGFCHPGGHVLRRDRSRAISGRSSSTTRTGSSPSRCPSASSPTSGTPTRRAPSTGGSRSSPTLPFPRFCPPGSAPTSTSSPTSPTTRSSRRRSRSGA